MVPFKNHSSADICLGSGLFLLLSLLGFLYPIFYLVKLRLAKNLRYPSRPRPTPLQPLNKPFTRPWDLDFNLHRLQPVHSFKESPGCKPKECERESPLVYFFLLAVNRIEQKGKWTIVASACIGGLPDTEDGKFFVLTSYMI